MIKVIKGAFGNWYVRILFVGILVRVVLMPITLHPDLWGHVFTSYFFAYEGEINIYQHLLSLPAQHPLVRNFGVSDIFIYPPLTYFTLGIFRFLFRPFTDYNFIPWLMENMPNVYQRKDLMWNIFVYKLPYLFIDLAMVYIFSRLFRDKEKQKKAFLLMLFNPLSLYSTFMIGQIDIFPAFFSILSVYFFMKGNVKMSLISLGIGGSYKMYPLLFILPLSFIAGHKLWPRLKLAFIGFLPFVLTIAPFLGSSAFRGMVLFSPKSQKMLFMNLPLSGAESLIVFIVVLSLMYSYLYYSEHYINPVSVILSILLLIFSVTHYHPQWFLWISPFLIWQLVSDNYKYWELVLFMFISWLIVTLFFEPSLSYGLFNPLNPQLNNSMGLTEIISPYTNVFQLKSMIRSIFAGLSIYYVYNLMNKKVIKSPDYEK